MKCLQSEWPGSDRTWIVLELICAVNMLRWPPIRFEVDMTAKDTKARENRARRAAERQGLLLLKCPKRDPHATGYGKFALSGGGRTADGVYALTLEEVEARLAGSIPGTPKAEPARAETTDAFIAEILADRREADDNAIFKLHPELVATRDRVARAKRREEFREAIGELGREKKTELAAALCDVIDGVADPEGGLAAARGAVDPEAPTEVNAPSLGEVAIKYAKHPGVRSALSSVLQADVTVDDPVADALWRCRLTGGLRDLHPVMHGAVHHRLDIVIAALGCAALANKPTKIRSALTRTLARMQAVLMAEPGRELTGKVEQHLWELRQDPAVQGAILKAIAAHLESEDVEETKPAL